MMSIGRNRCTLRNFYEQYIVKDYYKNLFVTLYTIENMNLIKLLGTKT
jgi:hypothetical protein